MLSEVRERVLAIFNLDFGATPRDEHLSCLLIKHKPMKLTSGYCFTCDAEWMIFFPGKWNTSLDGNLNHRGFHFIKDTGVFILFYYFSNRNSFPVY